MSATGSPEPEGRAAILISGWRTTVATLTALAVWLLATLSWRPLLVPDEGRYAEVARAMWQTGDWLVPRLAGLPFFHKPPLFYWLDMLAMQLVGANEFSGRFGSAVGAWLMGAALYCWLQRHRGLHAARTGLGMLATMPFFFVGGQYANHDMLVAGLITCAVLSFARAVDGAALLPARALAHAGGDAHVERKWLVLGWAFCGLAMLAKGLIGVVLPALVIAPWLLAQGRWGTLLKLLHPLGLVAFALIGLPWFIAMQMRFPEFFDYFVLEQHFRRFAGSNFNNAHGAWFFLVVLPLLTLPWSGWLPKAVKRLLRERHAIDALHAWWVIAIIGFFSLPTSKLIGYALPALTPWCALLAMGAASSPRRWVRGAMLGGAVVCVAAVGFVAIKAPQSNRPLGLALAAAKAPGDQVVMVDALFYDLPFYARLTQPFMITSNWADPAIAQHDNWRKELLDAARFDPTMARKVLRPLDDLKRLTCGKSNTWFVTPPDARARVSVLAGAQRVQASPTAELWRVPGRICSP